MLPVGLQSEEAPRFVSHSEGSNLAPPLLAEGKIERFRTVGMNFLTRNRNAATPRVMGTSRDRIHAHVSSNEERLSSWFSPRQSASHLAFFASPTYLSFMASRVQKILKEAEKLSPQDRARLRAELQDGDDSQDDVDASWTKEIAKRVHELERGDAELLDPQEVHARLFKKHGIR